MTDQPAGVRTIAIVDAYSSARNLAPSFRARGYECVHVRSSAVTNPTYGRSFRPGDFVSDIMHGGDVEATVAALRRHAPSCVIPGIESGVAMADVLSEALALRTNGTDLSSARRNKYRMMEVVRAAGIPAAKQILVDDLDTLQDWYAEMGCRVVLKPLESAGNDGVHFCRNVDEVRAAFGALLGSSSALGTQNRSVLAQEYLVGAEYLINAVSLDGRHHITDIWKMHHMAANGVSDLGAGANLLRRRGVEQDALVDHTLLVLDALGIRNGPTHSEVKLTPRGPRLIETASRMCGADLHVPVRTATGESQVEWTVDAYVDPDRFLARWKDDYVLIKHAGLVNMVSPAAGTLRGYPKMDELEALDSFLEVALATRPGEQVHRTIDDWTYPMRVYLAHDTESILVHDLTTARYLDGEGFYDIA